MRKYLMVNTAVVLVLPSANGCILQSSETNFERHFQAMSLKNVAQKCGVVNKWTLAIVREHMDGLDNSIFIHDDIGRIIASYG